MVTPFGARLAEAVSTYGPLCVGIDPHPGLLDDWGLSRDAGGVERFALTCVEAFAGRVAVVKPQSAFFEAHGSAGIAVLERVIAEFRGTGTQVLVDAKRGDIGSTMTAYAQAYLADGSPLAGDAITLSPYLGFGSLEPALRLAQETGRGIFVLARTSNPEGGTVQQATVADRSVAQTVVDEAAQRNADARPLGDIGVVIGVTLPRLDLDISALNGPILAPGFGAQGGTVERLRALFGPDLSGVLPASARDVLRHGPDLGALQDAALRVRNMLTNGG
ncbi:MAG TPA: orotidine-5'-phosphate decarboxylase [Pseudonocardiaceae bacterium]|nr:orotidine-5'-phosphate decarboxylase [Pseudonocardiaceae bacterium]